MRPRKSAKVMLFVHQAGSHLWETPFKNLDAAMEIIRQVIDIGEANKKEGIYTIDLFDYTRIKDVPVMTWYMDQLPPACIKLLS